MTLGTPRAVGTQIFGDSLLLAIAVGVPTYVLQRRLRQNLELNGNRRVATLYRWGRTVTMTAVAVAVVGVLLTI